MRSFLTPRCLSASTGLYVSVTPTVLLLQLAKRGCGETLLTPNIHLPLRTECPWEHVKMGPESEGQSFRSQHCSCGDTRPRTNAKTAQESRRCATSMQGHSHSTGLLCDLGLMT